MRRKTVIRARLLGQHGIELNINTQHFKCFIIYLFLAVLGLHCCWWAFSSCSEQGLRSSCGARASHCGGFSCFRAQALGPVGSVVAKHRLSSCGNRSLVAPWPVGSSQTRDQTRVSCIGRPILYRSATREVQQQV